MIHFVEVEAEYDAIKGPIYFTMIGVWRFYFLIHKGPLGSQPEWLYRLIAGW